MPNSRNLVGARPLPQVGGAAHRIDAAVPLRLDRLAAPFRVRRGHADLFAVTLTDAEATGARRHLLRVGAGGLVCGMPVAGNVAILVVGALDTEIESLAP